MSRAIDFSELTPHRGPEESLGFLLWKVSSCWRRKMEEALEPVGLTHPQFVILAGTGWFTRDGGRASQAKIGRHAGLDPNTTSQILRGLEAKGLIDRSRSPDERSKYPVLTERGVEVLTEAFPRVEAVNGQFFAPLGDGGRQSLLEALRGLV